ncbi:MAG TPA: hypothetical protein VHB21_14330 [Minicystis sp.]|nr:hypothetical protein [Minicystis sp.]
MSLGWQEALVAVVLVFVAFLVVKMRPTTAARGELAADVRAARDRAREARSSRERAEALCEAGRLAAGEGRWTAAAGFFLRAMNAEPAWPDAVVQASMSLSGRRPRLLEKMLWRRLDHVPWDAEHAAAARAAAVALAGLYEGKLRDRARAQVMRRMADRIG